MVDDSISEEEISVSTIYFLYFVGGILALCVGAVLYKALRAFFKRQEVEKSKNFRGSQYNSGRRATQKSKPSRQNPPHNKEEEIERLIQRQAAVDKTVDHPAYINSLKGFHSGVTRISFSPSGEEIATACQDDTIRVFKIENAEAKTFSLRRHEMPHDLIDVAFGANNEIFVLTEGGMGGAVVEKLELDFGRGQSWRSCWEAQQVLGSGQRGKGISGGVTNTGRSLLLAFSPQSNLAVLDSSGARLAAVSASGLQNHGAAFSRNGRFFAAATFTSDVKVFEVQFSREGGFKAVQKVMDLKKAHNSQVLCLGFSEDGGRAVTASKDGSWAVWNLQVRYQQDEDPKILMKASQKCGGERYSQLAFGPGDVIAASFGRSLHFLDGKSGSLLESVPEAHDAAITCLEWSPKAVKVGERSFWVLATASLDKRVRLWKLPQH